MARFPTPRRFPTRAGLLGLALLAAGCSSKAPEADTAEVAPDPAVVKPAADPAVPAAEGASSAPPAAAKP